MSLTVNSGNDMSALFSSVTGANNQNSGMYGLSGLLSEYNSIKNGSYAKLAKQFYTKSSDDKKTSDVTGSFKTKDDTEIKQNKSIISDVSSFKKSLSAITSDDTLFEKKTVKDENGVEKQDYDYDKIYSKLSSFAKSYNSVVESASESDNQTVLRNVLNMTNATDSSRKQLESIGVKINSDNTLSIDKDAMKSGDMSVAKYLFSKTSNFSRQLDTLSTNVASQAASDVYSLGGYTSTGAYKQTLETIYNTTI